ncbi:MAG: DnaB-like helicase N-terminal domain-containing protein, partial [Rhodospirillales bacterium]
MTADVAPLHGSAVHTLPHNVEAEKSLLGAIFVNNRAYETVREFLKPQHFSYIPHALIFEASA